MAEQPNKNPLDSTIPCPNCGATALCEGAYKHQLASLYFFECECGSITCIASGPELKLLQIGTTEAKTVAAGIVISQKSSAILVPKLQFDASKIKPS